MYQKEPSELTGLILIHHQKMYITLMTLYIPYTELQDILQAKTGKEVLLRTINEKTMSFGYDLKVKLPIVGTVSKTLWLNITVEGLVDEDLHLTYEAERGGDLLLKTLQKVISSAKYSSYVDFLDNKKVIVHLHRVEEIHKALQQLKIDSHIFKEDKVVLMFKVKV